jgi:glucosyl-3-phosphoglycerate synthase
MSMTVWEWFEQRSFRHGDYADLARSSGNGAERPSTTLIFPARNVAGTIGTILSVVDGLRARTGFPDQVIVVDADSPDGTADVARAHGAEVYSENELMRGYGPAQGKGDAMWRALSVATGDIVMFADADTDDFEEHFVYGTLGPLLADPQLQFVKAAFRRPFKQGEEKILDGGGRVTELMAKPLINLFYPELAGFVQPLAGEFAARREVLGTVPFFTGYGVEIGMLIDVFERVGLSAMAQVDLGTRQNRHQSLANLSRMSSIVLRTVAAREGLGERTNEDLDESMSNLWEAHQQDTYLHAVATEHGLRMDEHLNELVERPPLASLSDGTALTATALRGGQPPRSGEITRHRHGVRNSVSDLPGGGRPPGDLRLAGGLPGPGTTAAYASFLHAFPHGRTSPPGSRRANPGRFRLGQRPLMPARTGLVAKVNLVSR